MPDQPGTTPVVGLPGGPSRSPSHARADTRARRPPRRSRDAAFGPAAQVAAAIAGSLVLGAALGQTDQVFVALGAVGALALVALGFLRPALFLSAVLIIRPLLDEISTKTVGIPGANAAGAVALLVILLGFALVLRKSNVMSTPPAVGWVFVCIITAGASLLAVANFGATVGFDPIADAIRVFSAAAIFFLAANVFATEQRVRRILIVAGLSGVIPAVWGLIEWPTLQTTIYSIDIARVSGPFVGPNPLGQFLAITILILVGMPKGWLSTKVRVAALIPQLICIVPTYSRVGWIMLVLGLAILEWRHRKHLVIGMVVVVASIVLFVPSVHGRLLPSDTPTPGEAPTYESFGWRFDNWGTLLQLWTDRPFTGYGTKTTIYVNPRRTVFHELAPDGGFEAHNSVVRILVEGGIALLIGYVAFAVLLARSLRRMRKARWRLQPVARLLSIIWLLVLIVAIGTDDPFDNTAVLFLLFTLTGAVEGTYRLQRAHSTSGSRAVSPPLYLPARPRTS